MALGYNITGAFLNKGEFMYKEVDSKMDLPKTEEKILNFWEENQIFAKTLEKTKDSPLYSFFDGPPFATGTPHYGHIVASTMKDVVPRYWTMRGFKVPRLWGWDCHGLPIENIAEKKLGITHKKEIEEIGVKKFNETCRTSVLGYVEDWKKVIKRLGRWANIDNAYKTMDLSYMESVWWVFKQLWDKKLIYEGYRSMHICPRCETTLSQSEVTEGYKDIKDLSATVKFCLKPGQKWGRGYQTKDKAFILAWTTTPWTLIANVALAVGKDIKYSAVRVNGVPELLILAKDQVKNVLQNHNYEIVHDEIKGSDLVGLEYEPVFSYYADNEKLENRSNGWKIYAADFVTIEDGTGVVHIAPAFGEDDMNLGKEKKLPFVQHIAMDGIIKSEVTDFAGKSVKPKDDYKKTDNLILENLSKRNLLFVSEEFEHSYPHCWRCETPLLNYATSSWFVSIEEIKNKAIELSTNINWFPEHIKKGRFGKWLEGAKDWSISRQRYWASVIPIWKCEKCGELKVIGSIDELRKNTNKKITKIIFVRHGQSENNVRNINSCDEKKWPLTNKGIQQAEDLAKKINAKDIDAIFSSPVLRAKQTALILAKKINKKVITDELISEYDFGDWCEIPKDELIKTADYKKHALAKKDLSVKFNYKFKNGESRADVEKRVLKFLKKINEQYSGKNILIVSHGGINALLAKILVGASLEHADYIEGDTAHCKEISYYMDENCQPFDLHKDYIDRVVLKCGRCGGTASRISDVLDTWFDSGSMPYAEDHYPFENVDLFEQSFPAKFIAEGADQTRAWFYYLHVIASAIKNSRAYDNVIVNGIVLAADGKKMSKRLQNYPDPMLMFDKYGADVLRFYLMSSPVVAAENLNFKEEELADIYRGVFRMLWNCYSFFVLYANIDNWNVNNNEHVESTNLLDKWIISELNKLIADVNKSMEEYNLMKAARLFPTFIDNLSNWYIRRSRRRFWKSENDSDKNMAYHTLYEVLNTLAKLMAPFTPFLADEIYKNLTNNLSVHLADFPQSKVELIDKALIKEMNEARIIVAMGLSKRAEANIKVRQPLSELTYNSHKLRTEIEAIIAEEVNVKKVRFDEKIGEMEVDLDTTITSELRNEGLAREIIRNIQSLRKKTNFSVNDRIHLYFETESKELANAINKMSELIAKEVLAELIEQKREKIEGEEEFKIENFNLWVGIKKK